MSVELGTHGAFAVRRRTAGELERDKLYYAQVREDPRLELEALARGPGARLLVVSSGGCTSLSLLAAGAGEVVSIDRNPTQNDLVELKAVAVARLGSEGATRFLGGWADGDRLATFERLREELSPAARETWTSRARAVRDGVLGAGITEKFVHGVSLLVKSTIHPRSRIERMLAAATLDEQRHLYETTWNNRRWRALFPVLLNRFVFRKTYDPAFFEFVEQPSFARHFHDLLKHVMTDLPIRENYFLHYMLLDRYPEGIAEGLPPYLAPEGARCVAEGLDRLTLEDADITAYLERCDAASFDGVAASNVGEWMDEAALDRFLRALARVLKPGARACIRNFVGWTPLPAWWDEACPEVKAFGARIRDDRSGVQRRFVVAEKAS